MTPKLSPELSARSNTMNPQRPCKDLSPITEGQRLVNGEDEASSLKRFRV